MATERLSMHKAREILRQKWDLCRTHREIAASVGQSLGAVATTLGRARAAGLDWAQAQGLSDAALEERIYGPKAEGAPRPMPEFEYLHAERKKPGVNAGAAPPRVPGEAAGRLPVHPVLRALPSLAEEAWPHHAPGAQGRREALRRLLGEEAAPRRPKDRRGDRGRALRRGAGRVELHLRQGDPDAAWPGLHRQPREGLQSSSVG